MEQLSLFGVTQGCGGGNYCGPNSVTRSQMAFFLLKAEHGPDYTPPPCTTQRFNDVPCSQFFSDYINQLAEEGITLGCGGGNYCPSGIVARSQMAAFLLRAVEQGTGYAPPACTGLFADVPCSDPLAPWVEELARRGITSGCGSGMYCPLDPVTRGQMAIFLTRAFQLGWTYLTTDHLGTPVLASNRSARALWQGGFEPFGDGWNGAEEKGIFLRFPGQWVDASWEGGTAYNVFRWYEEGTGRYTRPDPIAWNRGFRFYRYAHSAPLRWIDSWGLSEENAADAGGELARTMMEDLDCIRRIRDQVRENARGRTRYQHCLGNCLITKECPSNFLAAWTASLFKEFSDMFRCLGGGRPGNCYSAFQPTDFDDNEIGRSCPAELSCHDRCRRFFDGPESQEGPPGLFGKANSIGS